MRKWFVLFSLLLAFSLISPSLVFSESKGHLSEEEGLELDWSFTETPPKMPQPKLLNPAEYEVKWKMDNVLLLGLAQDQQGVLYTTDSKDRIRAVYPNGKEKWNIQLDMGPGSSVIYVQIGQDGTIYAWSNDKLKENGLTTIYALSPDGEIRWKIQSSSIYSNFDQQIAGDAKSNFYYFSSEGLVSVNAKGEVNWINKTITSSAPRDLLKYTRTHYPSVFIDKSGNLYLDTIDGEVISLDASGKQRWRSKPLPFLNRFTGFDPYISSQGLLYFLTETGLHAILASDGSMVDVSEKQDMNDIQAAGVPTDGLDGYYLSYSGKILKMNRSGDLIWEYQRRESEINGIPPVHQPLTDKNGNVYFATGVGNIIVLNPDGQEIFVFLRNAHWSKLVNLQLDQNGNIHSTNYDIGLVSFGKKEIQVFFNNLSLPLAVSPINKDGTVLVPFRALFESLDLRVGWEPTSQTITGDKEGLSIRLSIGDKTAFVNGQAKQLSEAPFIENNTTFVPLRFVGEALGMKVTWEDSNSSINMDPY